MFPELPAIEKGFRVFSHIPQPAPKLWVDAYLAAQAAANEATLVTFDQAFAGYRGIECRILSAAT